jgi:hypothetical protein
MPCVAVCGSLLLGVWTLAQSYVGLSPSHYWAVALPFRLVCVSYYCAH